MSCPGAVVGLVVAVGSIGKVYLGDATFGAAG